MIPERSEGWNSITLLLQIEDGNSIVSFVPYTKFNIH